MHYQQKLFKKKVKFCLLGLSITKNKATNFRDCNVNKKICKMCFQIKRFLTSGSLDIIVKAAHSLSITLKQLEAVVIAEIFELQKTLWPFVLYSSDELVHKLVILLILHFWSFFTLKIIQKLQRIGARSYVLCTICKRELQVLLNVTHIISETIESGRHNIKKIFKQYSNVFKPTHTK